MTNQQDALSRAIEEIGAQEVAPGRYAIKSDDGWIVIREQGCLCGSGLGLVEQLERFDGFQPSEVFLGAVLSHSIEMPAWWSPERRDVYRVTEPTPRRGDIIPFTEAGAQRILDEQLCAERITADLETGQEVPA